MYELLFGDKWEGNQKLITSQSSNLAFSGHMVFQIQRDLGQQ